MTRQTSIKRSFRIIQGVVGLLLIFLIIQGFILWRDCNKGVMATQGLTDKGLPSLQYMAQLQQNLVLYRLHSFELMFAQATERTAKISVVNEDQRKNLEIIAALNSLYPSGKEHEYVSNLESSLDAYVTTMGKIRGLQDSDFVEAMRMLDQVVPNLVKNLNDAADQVNAYCAGVARESTNLTVGSFNRIRHSVLGLGSASIGFAALAALLVTINSSRVRRSLTKLVDSLNNGSEHHIDSASTVAEASQSLAEGSSEQAASIEETSSSLEELSTMTTRNTENSHNANELAKQARIAADNGSTDMQAMSVAMEAIKKSSDDIAKIIKNIDEIAFQTNILALNAAVEAARAGEAGMGFAVVASEVRNLAQRSAQAAKDTADKIEDAINKTRQGVAITGKVAVAFNEIVVKSRQVDELTTEVANASKEQTLGISQINTAVNQMGQVTQRNAASAEECAAAATELNTQAAEMKETVAELLALVGSTNHNRDTSPQERPPIQAVKNSHSSQMSKSKNQYSSRLRSVQSQVVNSSNLL